MADIKNLVIGSTTVGANYEKFVINTSDAGREIVISATKTDMTDADLQAVYYQLTLTAGDGTGSDFDGPDAFSIAGFGTANGAPFASGVTDVVFFRIQGTGTPNLTAVSGVTLVAIAHFQPAL